MEGFINNNFANIAGIYGYIVGIIFLLLIEFAIIALTLVSMWKIFTKAGKPGWAAIIPFYSILVELELLGRPWWFLLLMFVPFANFVISIIIAFDMAKVFGKSTGFGFGVLLLPIIFFPILAFSPAKYIGPVAGQ
jgi:hypothetical protein